MSTKKSINTTRHINIYLAVNEDQKYKTNENYSRLINLTLNHLVFKHTNKSLDTINI